MGGTLSGRRDTRDASPTPQFVEPTGLYSTCNWDVKVIKRLVINKKLAPIYPGREDCNEDGYEECPICFLFYPGGLNRSNCCRKGICTECFLQIKKPNSQATCPFCNRTSYTITFSGPLSKEERDKEAQEQQKVIELRIKIRNEEMEQDRVKQNQKAANNTQNPTNSNTTATQDEVTVTSATTPSSPEPEPMVSQSLPTRPMELFNSSALSTSYPPPSSKRPKEGRTDVDLEELMLMEAIRLSLISSSPPTEGIDKSSGESRGVYSTNEKDNSSDSDSDEESLTPSSRNSLAETNKYVHNDSKAEEEGNFEQEQDEAFELALAISMSLEKSLDSDR